MWGSGMGRSRRSSSAKRAKTETRHRKIRSAGRNTKATTGRKSGRGETPLDACRRELAEALAQQAATSQLLQVISSSQTDVQPVFNTIASSVARLCKAQFCHVFRFDGQLIHFAAQYGYGPEAADVIR